MDSGLLRKFEDNLKRLTKETIRTVKLQEGKKDETNKRKDLIIKIENLILEMVKALKAGQPLKFVVTNLKDWDNCVFNDKLCLKNEKAKTQEIKFDTKNSQRNFAIILHLLAKIHILLIQDLTITRRELYYENIVLMKSQHEVDRAVKIICSLLNTPPWTLKVFGTSKGLVAGALSLKTEAGELIDCSVTGGIQMPQDVLSLTPTSKAQFILVVEKDAVFQKLLDEKVLKYLHPMILITGKGFPDVNTRLLVRLLWKTLMIPVFLLADADPHGIEIMSVYRFGSLSMSQHAEMLAVPAIRWLGVHPSDINTYNLKTIPFKKADEDKILSLSTRSYSVTIQTLLKEINLLKNMKLKAEIEAVTNIAPNYLSDVYIKLKIAMNELI